MLNPSVAVYTPHASPSQIPRSLLVGSFARLIFVIEFVVFFVVSALGTHDFQDIQWWPERGATIQTNLPQAVVQRIAAVGPGRVEASDRKVADVMVG